MTGAGHVGRTIVSGVLRSAPLRRLGWTLSIIGLLSIAVGVPGLTWQNRQNSDVFHRNVGRANILAKSVGALGVVLVILDRLRTEKETSPARLAEITDAAEAWHGARGGADRRRRVG